MDFGSPILEIVSAAYDPRWWSEKEAEELRSGNDDVRLQSIYRRVLLEEFDFSYRIQIKL